MTLSYSFTGGEIFWLAKGLLWLGFIVLLANESSHRFPSGQGQDFPSSGGAGGEGEDPNNRWKKYRKWLYVAAAALVVGIVSYLVLSDSDLPDPSPPDLPQDSLTKTVESLLQASPGKEVSLLNNNALEKQLSWASEKALQKTVEAVFEEVNHALTTYAYDKEQILQVVSEAIPSITEYKLTDPGGLNTLPKYIKTALRVKVEQELMGNGLYEYAKENLHIYKDELNNLTKDQLEVQVRVVLQDLIERVYFSVLQGEVLGLLEDFRPKLKIELQSLTNLDVLEARLESISSPLTLEEACQILGNQLEVTSMAIDFCCSAYHSYFLFQTNLNDPEFVQRMGPDTDRYVTEIVNMYLKGTTGGFIRDP